MLYVRTATTLRRKSDEMPGLRQDFWAWRDALASQGEGVGSSAPSICRSDLSCFVLAV